MPNEENAEARKPTTIEEIEAILNGPNPDSFEILPNGEIRAVPEGEGKKWKDLKPITFGTIRDVTHY